MSRYRLVPPARQDIKDICRYIRGNNPPAAVRFPRQPWAKFRLLASQPLLGKAQADDLAPGIRMLAVGSYVILYRPTGPAIEVVQVGHGAAISRHSRGRPPMST